MIKINRRMIFCLIYIITLGVLCINFLQLEISIGNASLIHFKYIILSILTLGFVNLFITILLQRFWLGSLLSGLFFSIIAIANFYVIEFRGMPITTQDILNVRTAFEVSRAYRFDISFSACLIVIFSILIIFFSILIKKIECNLEGIGRKKIIVMGISLFIIMVYMYFGYFSQNPIKPENVLSLSWTEGYYNYGYIPCSIEVLCKSIVPVKKPKEYDSTVIEEIVAQYAEEKGVSKKPDIVLILNESFYDLNLLTDLDTDIDVAAPIALYDTIQGYSSVQVSGGGTSISEYELLTSNSMHLLHGITPFNSLEFKDANSIVSYLKSLGYYTLGAHPESKVNYSRGRVYPKLGFDTIKFEEDFNDVEYYESRNQENGGMNLITDFSAYKNLLEWYEEMPEGPRFCYVLTMQNHSPYIFLKKEEMIVHDKTDYGQYDTQIDEYLSCIYYSYKAFAELIEYYKGLDRDVIVCMVGDHAPYFASNIASRDDLNAVERDINLCLTPFIIWSNYGLESKAYEPSSMIYLVPILLEEADVSLSPYYNYMLDIREEAPILTQLNHYINAEHSIIPYMEEEQYTSNEVKKYFFMEYNNILGTKNRIESAFEP